MFSMVDMSECPISFWVIFICTCLIEERGINMLELTQCAVYFRFFLKLFPVLPMLTAYPMQHEKRPTLFMHRLTDGSTEIEQIYIPQPKRKSRYENGFSVENMRIFGAFNPETKQHRLFRYHSLFLKLQNPG